jgi:hypothetical protein
VAMCRLGLGHTSTRCSQPVPSPPWPRMLCLSPGKKRGDVSALAPRADSQLVGCRTCAAWCGLTREALSIFVQGEEHHHAHDRAHHQRDAQACIKEALRLYPAIPVFPREAAADDALPTGHPVSKGALQGRPGGQGQDCERARRAHECADPYEQEREVQRETGGRSHCVFVCACVCVRVCVCACVCE